MADDLTQQFSGRMTAPMPSPGVRWRWSVGYYVILVVWLVIVYQKWFENLVGVPASRWLWKANEAYVVAILVPLFWDIIATIRGSDGVIRLVTTQTAGPSPVVRHVAWYAALLVSLALFEGPLYRTIFGERVPQRILTLRDVIVGLVAVAIYLDWSRGLWRTFAGGTARVVSRWARLFAYIGVLLANIMIYQEWFKQLVGHRVSNALDFHAEAFAVVFFVGVYFDVVLPLAGGDGLRAVAGAAHGAPRRGVVLTTWICGLLFFVWIGQGEARRWFDNGFGQWFVRSPEPPMAAIIFTLYFECSRSLDRVRPANPHI